MSKVIWRRVWAGGRMPTFAPPDHFSLLNFAPYYFNLLIWLLLTILLCSFSFSSISSRFAPREQFALILLLNCLVLFSHLASPYHFAHLIRIFNLFFSSYLVPPDHFASWWYGSSWPFFTRPLFTILPSSFSCSWPFCPSWLFCSPHLVLPKHFALSFGSFRLFFSPSCGFLIWLRTIFFSLFGSCWQFTHFIWLLATISLSSFERSWSYCSPRLVSSKRFFLLISSA